MRNTWIDKIKDILNKYEYNNTIKETHLAFE